MTQNTTTESANPLLTRSALPFELPDFAAITDSHYREAFAAGMAEHLDELQAIALDPAPASVENVIDAWERAGQVLTRACYCFWTAQSADTNDERDAINAEVAPKLAEHADAILLDRRLFDRLSALDARARAGEVTLDDQQSYWLSEQLRAFRRQGIDLPAADQERLRALNTQLAAASAEFDVACIAGRNAAAVLITDEADLAGLSDDQRAGARADAEAAGHDEGWLLTLQNTTPQPILVALESPDVRRRVLEASLGRGLGGEHDTRDVIVRIARLRAEKARLLGHPHYASYAADDGCAKTTDAVDGFLRQLVPGVVANVEREAAELGARFAELAPGVEFEAADWEFVEGVVKAERLSLDDATLAPYLEFENVLVRGVFAAATALYGITFAERPELVGFVPEARVFEVFDADGSSLGALVIDPYTRPSKSGGAWMTNLVDQNTLLDQRPVVTNTCNFPPPAQGKPSLLTWDNVITLFHEFGHALHGLLSDVTYHSTNGTEVPRDFVEFPSQVNEMWAFEPAIIEQYAVHHETGEAMPAEWVETLRDSRDFGVGFHTASLLGAMLLDQAWHQATLDELPTTADEVETFEQIALERAGMGLALVPPRYRTAYFSHTWGGSYAAAYYAYLWSEIFDADTVAWFAENGGLTRENGEHFRRTLLAPGGSVDPMQSYRAFRGADPDPKHLLARMGVTR